MSVGKGVVAFAFVRPQARGWVRGRGRVFLIPCPCNTWPPQPQPQLGLEAFVWLELGLVYTLNAHTSITRRVACHNIP